MSGWSKYDKWRAWLDPPISPVPSNPVVVECVRDLLEVIERCKRAESGTLSRGTSA